MNALSSFFTVSLHDRIVFSDWQPLTMVRPSSVSVSPSSCILLHSAVMPLWKKKKSDRLSPMIVPRIPALLDPRLCRTFFLKQRAVLDNGQPDAFLERHGSNQHRRSGDFMEHVFAACQIQGVIDARVIELDRVIIASPQLVTIHHVDRCVEVFFLAKLGQLLLKGLQIV